MNFGDALKALKKEELVRRASWPEDVVLFVDKVSFCVDYAGETARVWSISHEDIIADDWQVVEEVETEES